VLLDAGAGFASYLWSTGETTQTISAKVSSEYSVVVTNEFGCTANDAMVLNVVLTPDKPVITVGAASVDNFSPASTVYTCNEAANANTYSWAVTPSEAGTTSSTGTSAEFIWAAGYTGTVQVTVVASNSCFTGESSDAFTTNIYTSAGLGENSAEKQLIIFPNPTDGKITMKLPVSGAFTGDLTVTDANGGTILSKKGLTIPAGESANLDLGQFPDGVYSVKLSSNNTTFFGKVIIR
jgi:hypothetical protein